MSSRLALLGTNLLDGALAELNNALKLDPWHAAALAGRAEIFCIKGLHAEAIDTFKNAGSIGGFNPTWALCLAFTYFAAGDITAAKHWNGLVIRADPTANLPWAQDGHIKRTYGGWFASRSFRQARTPL